MSDKFRVAAGVILIIAMAVLIGVATCRYIEKRRRCTDNGGEWVRYDCHTNVEFRCSYDSKGNMQECHTETYESCKEKCVGASPEAN